MQNILVFGGTKQAGKSSAARYVVGSQLKRAGAISHFEINEDGHLLVNTKYDDVNGVTQDAMGILDIYRTDIDFVRYAAEKIWPHCKVYSFATILKESAIAIFGLNPAEVYGSDEDKNKLTKIKWSDLSALTGRTDVPEGYMTNRQVLQEFGTICRKLKPDCWIAACYSQIIAEGYPNVIIDDCRYENEVDYGAARKANTVLLTRQPFVDDHSSEKIHEVSRSKFQFILDNANMTLEQKHNELENILVSAGWSTGIIS